MKRQNKYLKQIVLCFTTALLLAIALPAPKVYADFYGMWEENEIPSTRQKERLVDEADLLTDSEEAALLSKLNTLSQKHQSNIVILTVDDYTGDAESYSDDYFDYNGFQADYDSGVMFFLGMSDRAYWFSTFGSAIYAFTDYGISELGDTVVPYLADGDYYGAFNRYIEVADNYFTLYEEGTPFDVSSQPEEPKNIPLAIGICIIIGLLGALIPLFIMVADLTTVRKSVNASGYQSHSGIKLTVHNDKFIRATTNRTRRAESSSSGGSSTHSSSSGSSHGGGGGHF